MLCEEPWFTWGRFPHFRTGLIQARTSLITKRFSQCIHTAGEGNVCWIYRGGEGKWKVVLVFCQEAHHLSGYYGSRLSPCAQEDRGRARGISRQHAKGIMLRLAWYEPWCLRLRHISKCSGARFEKVNVNVICRSRPPPLVWNFKKGGIKIGYLAVQSRGAEIAWPIAILNPMQHVVLLAFHRSLWLSWAWGAYGTRQWS